MEIQQLKGFLAVARYRNFTIAAEKTHRTQPTISLQVKSLEEELGVRLFERLGPRKVTLTPEGEILQNIASPLIDDFEHLLERFNEARGLFGTSSVRVLTHRSVMVHMLPDVVKKFKSKFPDCKLSILNRSRSDIVNMVATGEADLGITSVLHPPASVDYEVLAQYNRILIATKGHPLSKKKNISLEDVAAYPLILPQEGYNTRRVVDHRLSDEGLDYNLAMEIVGRDAIKTYVGMNLGISIMNEYYVSESDKKRLFVKDMSGYFGHAETGVVLRKGREMSAPLECFLELLREKTRSS